MPRERSPEQRLADLEAFAARHQRMPLSRTRGESGLHRWITTTLNGRRPAPAPVKQRLAELVGGLPRKVGRPPAAPPAERIAQLHAFVVKHGRLPRERDKHGEAPLARWAAVALRPGSALTPEQRATVERIRNDYLYAHLRRR